MIKNTKFLLLVSCLLAGTVAQQAFSQGLNNPAFDSFLSDIIGGSVLSGIGIVALMIGGLAFLLTGKIMPLVMGILLFAAPFTMRVFLGVGDDLGSAEVTQESEGSSYIVWVWAVLITFAVAVAAHKFIVGVREEARVDTLLEQFEEVRDRESENSSDNMPSLDELANRNNTTESQGRIISTTTPSSSGESVQKNKRKVILD